MKKFILLIFSVVMFFSLYAGKVQAQVVVNEFSSWSNSEDWVELFNYGNTGIDLSDYMIRDSTSNNKVTLTGTIDPNGFAVFGFTNRLNKSGDTVRLIKIENSEEIEIDSIAYGGTDQVCAPGDGETIGRVPDGGNVFERLSESTKNSTNTSVLDPCPTPTPDATPTTLPTLTSTPQPTNTQTPTKKSTPTVTATIAPSKKPTIFSATPSAEESVTIYNDRTTGSVLSDTKTEQGSVNFEGSGLSETKAENNIKTLAKKVILPVMLIVTGITAMLSALGSVIKKNKKKI